MGFLTPNLRLIGQPDMPIHILSYLMDQQRALTNLGAGNQVHYGSLHSFITRDSHCELQAAGNV